MAENDISNLEQLLDKASEAAKERDRVSFDRVLDMIGRRSFGPMLLLAGVIISLPIIGDIPGVPVLMGMFVIMISLQMILRREHLWLPQWMLRRSVSRDKFCSTLEKGRRVVRFVDRFIRPRLTLFARGAAVYVIAFTCMAISAATPAMEFIPFSANVAGLALTAFGLALIARDGLLAIIAFMCTAGAAGLIVYNVL